MCLCSEVGYKLTLKHYKQINSEQPDIMLEREGKLWNKIKALKMWIKWEMA